MTTIRLDQNFETTRKNQTQNMLAANVYHDDDANRGVIEVLVPDIQKERPNVQFVLTIDVSGSMNTPAVCRGENGNDLNQGWSNLDINIHGILTLIGMLKEGDYLCMISFEFIDVE